MLDIVASSIIGIVVIESQLNAKQKEEHGYANDLFSCNLGFDLHCGDPERYDQNGNKRNRQSPIVENAMVSSIENQKGDSVATFGDEHIPFIIEKLSAQPNPNIALVAYDISSTEVKITGSVDEVARVRFEKLKSFKEKEVIKNIIIDGAEPTLPDAFQMMLTASVKHRAKTLTANGLPELDPKAATKLEQLIPVIYKDVSNNVKRGVGR